MMHKIAKNTMGRTSKAFLAKVVSDFGMVTGWAVALAFCCQHRNDTLGKLTSIPSICPLAYCEKNEYMIQYRHEIYRKSGFCHRQGTI